MADILLSYKALFTASLVLAVLVYVQVLVADFAGVAAKHVPGTPVSGGHDVFHFRAVRALANSNETLPLQALLVLAAVGLAADPRWAGYAAWTYTAARAGHMACYYADLRLARSIAFGIGLAAQAALLLACLLKS